MALTTKRLQWLKWLYPGEAGLQNEQQWHMDKRRQHMAGEHVPGVTVGLKVLASGAPDLNVHVQVGRGIDVAGEEIRVTGVVDLNLSSYASGGGTAYIVAEYGEAGSDPYIVPETSASQNKFWEDDPQITHQGTPASGNQIELARVAVSNGATAIDDAADPQYPGTDEIDMTHRTFAWTTLRETPLRYQGILYDLDDDGAPNWRVGWPAEWIILDPANGTLNSQIATYGTIGKRYWLKNGTYTMDAALNIQACILAGAAPNFVTIEMTSASARFNLNTGHNTLINLRIRAGTGGASTTDWLIHTNGADNRISRCYFDYAGQHRKGAIGIFSPSLRLVIEGCEFYGTATDAVSDAGEIAWDASEVAGPVTIRDCSFRVCVDSAAPAIYGDTSLATAGTGIVLVENCEFKTDDGGFSSTFIVLDSNWTVRGCRFAVQASDTMRGIALGPGTNPRDNINIEGNEFVDVTNAAVYLSPGGICAKVRIVGNYVHTERSGFTYAMYVDNFRTGTLIAHNVLINETYGFMQIRVSNANDTKIIGNTVRAYGQTSQTGIYVSAGTGALIMGNYIDIFTDGGRSSDGISCSVSRSRIIGNYIVVSDNNSSGIDDWVFGIYASAAYTHIEGNNIQVGSDNASETPAGWVIYVASFQSNIAGNHLERLASGSAPLVGLIIAAGGVNQRHIISGNNMYQGFGVNNSIDGQSRDGIWATNIYKNSPVGMTGFTDGGNRGYA